MSPEQAKGRDADKRSDVWAFGCILFEMLSGRRAFQGEDVSDTLASILRGEPDWAALPANLPPATRILLERCLVKDRARRISDMSTVKFLLDDAGAIGTMAESRAGATARGRRSMPWAAALAGVLAGAAVTAAIMMNLDRATAPGSPQAAQRLSVPLPFGAVLEDKDIVPIAISPDGVHIAFSALADGKVLLYQRALHEVESKPLAGTEGAQSPFFSSDGKWIGFFANSQLKKVALGGGALQVLCPAPFGRGGTWGDNGEIYFAATNVTGIWRVSQDGGTATPLTQLDRERGEVSHRWPQALPGNLGLIFTVWTGPGPDEKAVVFRSSSGERHIVVRGGDRGRFVAPGYLVYARGDALMAIPFDPAQPATSSAAPTPLPGSVPGDAAEGAGFEVSAAGILAALPAGPNRLARRLVWVDEAGRADPLPLPQQQFEHVSVSPDGTRAVVQILEGVVNLWMYDFSRGALTPFVKAGSSTQAPVWTPDSRYVIYRGTRNGWRNLFRKAADGSGGEERLTTKEGVNQTPQSVSPDGKWLVFAEVGGSTGQDLFRVTLDGKHTVEPLLVGPGEDRSGVVSPNGSVMAYVAADSGREEVYVRPFPGPGPRIPVSQDGGIEPLWSADGRRLFFVSGNRFMAADVTSAPSPRASVPRQLYQGWFQFSPNGATPFGLGPDGRVLRVQLVQPDPPVTRVDLVLNWREELRRLVK
jgi:serine/threonine-protein kinase